MKRYKKQFSTTSALLLLWCAPAFAACDHSVSALWAAAKAEGLVINAYHLGKRCGTGAVLLTVSEKDGRVLWSLARNASDVSIFSGDGMNTDAAIRRELKNWIEIGLGGTKTTEALPDWPKGAEQPVREGEFGYFAGDSVSREFYLQQRAAKRPLFCTVSGMESETCIISLGKGQVTDFGGMTFPG
jgi:hypothetical protein